MIEYDPVLVRYDFSDKAPIIFGCVSHAPMPEPIYDMHLSFELGVVISGSMDRYSDNLRFELQRGGVWLTGMLEPHGRNPLTPDCKVAVFIISPEFFSSTVISHINSRIWEKPFNTSPESRPMLVDEKFALMAENLLELVEADSSSELKEAQIQLTLLEIILHINRIGTFETGNESTPTDLRRLQPAFELIFNSSNPVSTPEAAALCKLSSSVFAQLFIQATGQSFRKFSLRYRLSQVAAELKNSDLSLDELAVKWGFTDKSHLANRFKENYKTTPTLYRKQ